MYYPCSENKGADQLRGYREADLRASLFSHMQIVGFLMRRLICLFIHVFETSLNNFMHNYCFFAHFVDYEMLCSANMV